MGSLKINIETLNNFFLKPNTDNSWENGQIEKFIKRAFSIGKDKTIEDVFEKNLGLIQLEFDYFEFFKLSKNNNAKKYFENYIENDSDFDDVLFDLAENYFDEFNKLYKENYFPPREKPEIRYAASESFSVSKRDDFKNSIFDKFYEQRDKEKPDLKPILDELVKKIEFCQTILDQLNSNQNLGQENLLNENLKKLLQVQTDKAMKGDLNKNNLRFWENLLYRYSMQEEETRRFFEEDHYRTKEFFKNTLCELQTIKEMILNFEFNSNNKDENLNSSLSYERDNSLDLQMSMSSNFFDYEEEIPETLEETLNRLTKKINITINKDLFVNSFAIERFFDYYKDIRKIKSDVLPIIEEWKEE